jgi:endonuclease/exonuclease/phosphatase (EEP) superfamily protein YafD
MKRSLFIPLLLIGHALGLNLYLLAYALTWDAIPLMAQASHLAHFITLSAFPLALLAWFYTRRATLLLIYLPGVLAFVLWYGPLFDPPPQTAPPAQTLTVATYNLRWYSWEAGEREDLAALILSLEADIVALQELKNGPLRWLQADLAAAYPYQVLIPQGYFDVLGLFSRYPIVESNLAAEYDFIYGGLDRPRYLRAVVRVGEQKIAVYNFHPYRPKFSLGLSYDDRRNRENYEQFLTALEGEALPALVLCDCNASPRTRQYAWMRGAGLADLHQAAGWGLGLTHVGLPWLPFPSPNITRVDFIWYETGGPFVPLGAGLGPGNGGSDHTPLWGRLGLKGGANNLK